ncbi:MAG: glycerol-3-phosphate 1-O-acyltransferase PlsY [Ardenticatenales bacterium]|nr:glycerol-3-phosphate 1-O-acyltransferase PlsY [Ardenticatenales bacterium]
MYLNYFLAALLGYFFGAFPTGYIAGRMIGHVDVREMGSGRTGGTNVLRSAGRNAAIVTIVGDIAKGALAVIVARLIWDGDPMAAALAAIFSVIGHNYSVFLKFKGGAGTMTAAGALLALHPVVLVLAALIPLIMTYITMMTSIGSLLGSAIGLLLGVVLAWNGDIPWESLIFFVPFFLLSWYSHRPNLARLRAGNERRIGDKAKAPS